VINIGEREKLHANLCVSRKIFSGILLAKSQTMASGSSVLFEEGLAANTPTLTPTLSRLMAVSILRFAKSAIA
jgi:hypothetical protein